MSLASLAAASRSLSQVLFIVLVVACTSSAESADHGISDAPRALYVDYGCFSCHGYEGQGGGTYGGPRIAPGVWPLQAFVAQVRRPRGSPFAMPPYSPTALSDADLLQIYNYLRRIPEVDATLR
jgi:mono/diheme cytochrome c family protein